MRKIISVIALCVLLAMSITLNAQRPAGKISGERHPNLAAAQRLSKQAYEKVVDAQRANEWDMGGHAEKAKLLLEQVNTELKLAAEAANEHRRK